MATRTTRVTDVISRNVPENRMDPATARKKRSAKKMSAPWTSSVTVTLAVSHPCGISLIGGTRVLPSGDSFCCGCSKFANPR